MPFPTAALTADQLTLLRGASVTVPTYASGQYIALCPNTTVFAARVNQATFVTSFAQITFDTVTVGAFGDVKDGQPVLISHTNDRRAAFFVGRVRADNSGVVSTSTVLNVNETSAALADNDYVFVIDDYRVHDRLAKQSGATQLKDYALTFAQLKPLITNLQSAYIGVASGSPTPTFSVSFAATAIAGTSGATISSYLYTTPDGSVTAGSLSTANVTIAFPVGFRWVTLVVTDSGSRTATRRIPVWSVPSDFSSVVTLGFGGTSLQRGDSGDASVEAFDGVDTVLDNTLIVAFSVNYYNGDETNILTNVDMVGRIRKETDNTVSDATYSQMQKASYEIEGALSQFGRIEHLPFTLTNKASPTAWDQITNLTPWRAILHTLQRHSTYLDLFALNFDSTDNTFLYLALPTQGGNILSVIQDLAVSINANIEVAPTGETRVVRDAIYLTGGQRAALPTIMNGTMQDLINIDSLEVTQISTTGKIQGSGGFYNSTSGKVIPLLSLAPGVAQDIGEGISSFTRQVLQANQTQAAAQSELNTRTGHEYANKRRDVTTLNLTLPGGYNWLIPSRAQWYTWTIPATETTGGRAFTTSERWQCVSASVQHDNGRGTKTVQASFRLETTGTAGQTVTYPPVTQIPPIIPTVPTIPPFPTFPPLPDISLPPNPTDDDAPPYVPAPVSDGNTVAIWSNAGNWIAKDVFYTNAPGWSEITPATLTITDFQWVGLGSKGAYILGNDGTDSVFFYAADAISPGAVWTSTSVSGVYTKIRPTSTAGGVYIMTFGGGSAVTEEFLGGEGPGGWTLIPFGAGIGCVPTTVGTYNAGQDRFEGTYCVDGDGKFCKIELDFGVPSTVVSIEVDVNWEATLITGSAFFSSAIDYDDVNKASSANNSPGVGPETLTYNVQTSGVSTVQLYSTAFTNAGDGFTYITGIRITYISGEAIKTRYSGNYGSTFAVAQTVGDEPGAYAGFDTQKVGLVTLVGTDGQVKIATTAGGTYSSYGSAMPAGSQPSAIWSPAKQFGGTTANSGANPQFLVASSALTAGNASLWKVTASGVTYTDITPSITGVFGTAVSPDCIAMSYVNGSKIAVIMSFAGVRHLLTSTNAGSSWTDRGTLDSVSNYVRFRKSDAQALQLFIANDDVLTVSPSLGANLISKSIASTTIIGAAPY